MKKTPYKNAKDDLLGIAKAIKKENPNDKPLQRMTINDYCDHLCKTRNLSEFKQSLLHNYASTLHP